MTLIDEINEQLKYDGKNFYNKINRNSKAKKDIKSGVLREDGYRLIQLNKRKYMEHHLVWMFHKKEISNNMQIDHINHIRDDNRIENLRIVSHIQNGQNQKKRITNTSGTTGVYWDKTRQQWKASIKVNYKMINLGRFKNKNDAIKIRLEAEEKYNFHENHGKGKI